MIENYIGWASYVNRTVLSESKITSGTDAKIEDTLKSGGKRSELQGAYCPDTYSVVMDFEADSNVKLYDENGNYVSTLPKTEYQYFLEWYKYKHKYGTVPFQFPKILYSPQAGIRVIDEYISNRASSNPEELRMEYYVITSVVEGTKSGSCIRVTMTWKTVYGGSLTITEEPATINGISLATHDYIDILFSAVSDTEPTKNLFSLFIDGPSAEIKNFYFDGAYTVRLWFNTLDSTVPHLITFAMTDYGGLEVAAGTYTASLGAVLNG